MQKRKNLCNFATLFLTTLFAICLFSLAAVREVHAAEPIEVGGYAEGVINQNNPVDEYAFTAEKYTLSYRVVLYSNVLRNLDLTIGIYDEAGNLLAEKSSDWDIEKDSVLQNFVEAPKCRPGKYYIRVSTPDTATEETEYKIRLAKCNNYGKVKLSKTQDEYTGKKQKLPKVAVYDCAGKKMNQSEYTYWFCTWNDMNNNALNAKYLNNKYRTEAGSYGLCIRYNWDYWSPESQGVLRCTEVIWDVYKITPEQTKIKKVETKNGTITATCRAGKVAAGNYKWQLSEDKSFKKCITRNKGTKVSFTGLDKGKTYYIRVCITSKNAISGKYSKPVKVKCK